MPQVTTGDAYLWFLSLLEEGLLALLLLALLFPGEVLGLGDLVYYFGVETAEIDFCGGRNDISGIYSSDGYAIDLEWAGDQESAFLEVLEENHTLATETTSEENEDGTGLEGGSWLAFTDGLASLY